MNQIQISAKAIGEIALEDFCERCFYIKIHSKKLPFQIFAGVISSLDSFEKKIINNWILRRQEKGDYPSFLDDLNVTGFIKPPHWSKFNCEIPKYGIKLTGMCDAIFILDNGHLHIADAKSAKWTVNQDRILPLYKAQLNGYSYIASQDAGLPPVDSLSLIYFEPQNSEEEAKVGTKKDGFQINFGIKYVPVAVDLESLDPLFEKTRQIFDGPVPEGRKGCKDCLSLNSIAELLGLQACPNEVEDLAQQIP